MINLYPKDHVKWLKFVRDIEQKYPVKAYIAGGCLRDHWFGLEPKDIDIFLVPLDVEDIWGLTVELRDNECWSVTNGYLDEDFQEQVTQGEEYITAVFEYKKYNIILLNEYHTLKAVLADFDFGICMIGMDSAGRMLITEKFTEDFNSRRLTCYRSRNTERRERRTAKMKAKFPDFELFVQC